MECDPGLWGPGILSVHASCTLGSGQLCLCMEQASMLPESPVLFLGLQAGHRAAPVSWSCVLLLWTPRALKGASLWQKPLTWYPHFFLTRGSHGGIWGAPRES